MRQHVGARPRRRAPRRRGSGARRARRGRRAGAGRRAAGGPARRRRRPPRGAPARRARRGLRRRAPTSRARRTWCPPSSAGGSAVGSRFGEQRQERAPVARRDGEEPHVAVRRRHHERGAVGVARIGRRAAPGRRARSRRSRITPRVERGERRLLHRHLDGLPRPCARAVEQRRERPGDGDDRRAVVRLVARKPAGRTVREARGPERARGREGRQRLEPPARPRTRAPEVGDRHVDEVRVAGADRRRRERARRASSGVEVLDQHVGAVAERRRSAASRPRRRDRARRRACRGSGRGTGANGPAPRRRPRTADAAGRDRRPAARP